MNSLALTIAGIAAVVAVFADGHPTIYSGLDTVLRAGFAFVVTFAAAQARRWSWLVLAGIPAAASRDLVGAVPAWAALTLAVTAILFDFRPRWVGALIGLLATSALLRLSPVGPHGFTALLTLVAVGPVCVSAYRRQRSTTRRRLRLAVGVGAAVVIVAITGLGVAILVGVPKVTTGIAEAQAGITSAKSGDDSGTTEHLQRAVAELDAGQSALHAWYAVPARLVPIVSYHAQALAQMSSTGNDLADTAAETVARANYRSIDVRDGRIDTAKIAALGAPLVEVQAALDRAQTQTDAIQTQWLLPPLHDKFDDLRNEVASTKDETATAIEAVSLAPAMLGANGPRHYFVAFTSPAESRGLGGFMGNWAELTADHGKLELTRTGRSGELAPLPGEPPRTLAAPKDYLTRYGPLQPQAFVGDATFSPDFPSDAQALESIYPQTRGGRPIDGVIAMDPYALAAMLQITGPIAVPGLPEPLTTQNAADYLLRRQYLTFDQKEDRIDVLDEAAHRTFDAFIHAKSLRPAQLATVLGPMVDQRRLLASSTEPAEQELITRLGLDGSFPPHDRGDFFSLVTQNAGNNKIDVYLKRAIEYRADLDPVTGNVKATATITLHNDAPASGLPDYVIGNRPSVKQPAGTNWIWFNFYSPHQLESATLDGKPFNIGAQIEFGLSVYQAFLPVPSGGDTKIELHLTGSIDPSRTYDMSWFQQPTVNTDHVRVVVTPTPPWTVSSPGSDGAGLAQAAGTTDSRTDGTQRFDLYPPAGAP